MSENKKSVGVADQPRKSSKPHRAVAGDALEEINGILDSSLNGDPGPLMGRIIDNIAASALKTIRDTECPNSGGLKLADVEAALGKAGGALVTVDWVVETLRARFGAAPASVKEASGGV